MFVFDIARVEVNVKLVHVYMCVKLSCSVVLALLFRLLINFELIFEIFYKVGVWVYPVVPALFMKEIILSLLNRLGIFWP